MILFFSDLKPRLISDVKSKEIENCLTFVSGIRPQNRNQAALMNLIKFARECRRTEYETTHAQRRDHTNQVNYRHIENPIMANIIAC